MKIWPFNLLDFLEVETQAKKDDLLAGIVLAMSNLEKQDEKILLLYFTCGYTVDEIVRKVGVCKATVSRALARCKKVLRSQNARVLIQYGHARGLQLLKTDFLRKEMNYKCIPTQQAFPEPIVCKALLSNGLRTLGDVERVCPILTQKVKGIGKKYQALIKLRLFDYSAVTKVRTQKKPTIRFASSPEFNKACKMIGVELV